MGDEQKAAETPAAEPEKKDPVAENEAVVAALRAELAEREATLESARALITEDPDLNQAWERALARQRGEEPEKVETSVKEDPEELDKKIVEKLRKGDAVDAINLALEPVKKELEALKAENAKLRSMTLQETAKTRADLELERFVQRHADDGLYVYDKASGTYVPGDREMLTEVNNAIAKHGTLSCDEALGLAMAKLGRGPKKQQKSRAPVGARAGEGAKTVSEDESSSGHMRDGAFNSEAIAREYGGDVLKDWRKR